MALFISLHVPKQLRPRLNSILSKLTMDFLTGKSCRSFQLLILVPKCLLPHSCMLTWRFSRWEQGGLRALWLDAARQSSGKETEITESLGPKLIRAVTRALSEGAYSMDISLLTGESRLAQTNEDTCAKLRTLHPPGTAFQRSVSYADLFAREDVQHKHVLKVLRSFKPVSVRARVVFVPFVT